MKRVWIIAGAALMSSTLAHADGFWRRGPDVAPANNPQYQSECGACHMAYQPGLLPARSWQRLMGDLANHFGDDASLSDQTRKALTDYLTLNAADRSDYRRSQKIMQTLDATDAPLRITETPYIRHKHGEIPARYITGNPKVGSLSNCAACHSTAAKGDYNEHGVHIPGVGTWDDD